MRVSVSTLRSWVFNPGSGSHWMYEDRGDHISIHADSNDGDTVEFDAIWIKPSGAMYGVRFGVSQWGLELQGNQAYRGLSRHQRSTCDRLEGEMHDLIRRM